jgi:hypothetical protein
MKKMMALVKTEKGANNDSKSSSNEKKKKREEKRKKYNDTPVCKHCGKKHPAKVEDECWELDKNASSRLVRQTESQVKVPEGARGLQ